jgi:hypothetical protein
MTAASGSTVDRATRRPWQLVRARLADVLGRERGVVQRHGTIDEAYPDRARATGAVHQRTELYEVERIHTRQKSASYATRLV